MKNEDRQGFSQRHPFIFGFTLLMAAAILLGGIAAVFRVFLGGGSLFPGETVGVANLEGVIMDSRRLVGWLETLRRDESVKGVVLRINSPGGGVGPSQEIYSAVKRLNAAKPVVVSMGPVAASGGYYAAAPARLIIANPGTVTGSIGVKMQLSDFRGLMEKLGIAYVGFASGKFKDSTSPFKEMTDEERAYLQALVMDLYDQFLTDVAEGRGIPVDELRKVADGRALTGRQALEHSLVDRLGDYHAALEACAELSGVVGDYSVVEGPEKKTGFFRDMLLGGEASVSIKEFFGPRWQFLYQ